MMDTELYVVKGKVFQQKKGFSAEIGDNIGYDKAAKMVKNYCDQQKENVTAHFMGRNIIEAILAQPGVVGIAMFNGINELGLQKPMLVGVDANGNNVLNVTTVADNGDIIKQKGIVAGGVRSYDGIGGGDDEGW